MEDQNDVVDAIAIRGESAELSRFLPVMSIEQAVQRREVVVQATQRLMKVDVDYGVIPGTGTKPTLLQPGADKLCNLFGLVIQYEVITSEEDWDGEAHKGEPFFYYRIKGRAYRGEHLMGEGVGSCSSWESKYRWRKTERACPTCGRATIIKGKEEYGGGWICFAKKGGCGAKFKHNDPAITDQVVGRSPNPDIADLPNTLLKMAYKRCKVSTTINATSASEFFTQDLDDQQLKGSDDTAPVATKTPKVTEYVNTKTGEVTSQPANALGLLSTATQEQIQKAFTALGFSGGQRTAKLLEFLTPEVDPEVGAQAGAQALLAWCRTEYKRTGGKAQPAKADNGKKAAPTLPVDPPPADEVPVPLTAEDIFRAEPSVRKPETAKSQLGF